MVNPILPEPVEAAVEYLLAARNGGRRIVDLPENCRPKEDRIAYAIQDALVTHLGSIVGWKVGAADEKSEPFRAALTAQTALSSSATVAHSGHVVVGVEAEIVYQFDKALPPRDELYTEQEVFSAIGSIHAAIEIVDTRYAVWGGATRLSQLADQFNHGRLIIGSGRAAEKLTDATQLPVKVLINGEVLIDKCGGNPAGSALRLMTWLANSGAISLGGLKEGTYVTTGSWTGVTFVAPNSHVEVAFEGVGSVAVGITG